MSYGSVKDHILSTTQALVDSGLCREFFMVHSEIIFYELGQKSLQPLGMKFLLGSVMQDFYRQQYNVAVAPVCGMCRLSTR